MQRKSIRAVAGCIAAAICVSAAPAAVAGSVAGFGGSTEYTQILNNLQLIQQYEQAASAYVCVFRRT